MACHAAASARRPCPLSFRRHGSGRTSGRLRRSPFAAIYRRRRRRAVEHGLGYTAVPAPLTGTSKLTSILLLCTVQRTLYYVVCRWYLPSRTHRRDHAGSCITWRVAVCRYGRTIPGARRGGFAWFRWIRTLRMQVLTLASAHHTAHTHSLSSGSTATETNGTMGITPPECNSCSPSHHIDEAL